MSADGIDALLGGVPRVAVVGDFMLDGWWSGSAHRLAREAPAPVVELDARSHAPGGAANAARNLAALGADARAVGLVGSDAAGRYLCAELARGRVDVSRLRAAHGRRTTTKVRITVDGQVLVRLDEAPSEPWPAASIARLVADARAAARECDVQLVCDYGAGALHDEVVAALARARTPRVRVVDAHDLRRWAPLRPDLVTPNAAEAERVLGEPLGEGEERARRLDGLGPRLLESTGARAAVVTLDRDGAVLVHPTRRHRTRAQPVEERQASGAGDVFTAAMTASLAAGVGLEPAMDLAQAAADIAVRTPGTCACTLDELAAALARRDGRPVPVGVVAARLARAHETGAHIVLVVGRFERIDGESARMLRAAKRRGDVLVVAVTDAAAPAAGSPSAGERAALLAELECVDYATVVDGDDARGLARRLHADVDQREPGADAAPAPVPAPVPEPTP